MSKYCSCQDWKDNLDKVNSIFSIAHIHGCRYDGKEYECCPWCGVLLKKEKNGESATETKG